MYAVIKTGGKQYRVSPGDLLVVEKLDGAPGAKVAFDQVLLVGDGDKVTVGAPIVSGASVSATLVETRKGVKVKIFKKIRRQGYRRTKGHRQQESVLRVTALAAGGRTEAWDGTVDLTPLSELNLRARNLARLGKPAAPLTPAGVDVEVIAKPKGKGKSPIVEVEVVETAEAVAPETVTAAPEAKAEPKAKAAPKKTKPPKTKATAAALKPTKGGPPKPTKGGAPKMTVRKTAPRGNKG